MKKAPEHLLFFDEDCPLCVRAVRHLIAIDEGQVFVFAPLKGETAKEILSGPQSELKKVNSLVVVEHWRSTHRQFWIRSRAIFRTYWLIGGQWKFYGCFSYLLPAWLTDFFYNWVSEHRHQFTIRPEGEIGPQERFLP